jgi:hypothetical protein
MSAGPAHFLEHRPAPKPRGIAEPGECFGDGLEVLDRGLRNFRPSPDLPAREIHALDAMMQAHGLRAVLSAITQLCYARARDDGSEEHFDDFDAQESWYRAAKVVETATINDRVDMK